MAEQNKMQMPGVFGGLMRYDDEYTSKFMISPIAVIAYLVVLIIFVLVLKIFFPIDLPVIGGVSGGPSGMILGLLGI